MEFALVNKGRFWMGGTGGHVGDKEVEIPEDFYLGLYEVTQGDWEAVTGANPSYFSPLGEGRKEVEGVSPKDLKKFPVENVSWNDVQAFLARLNERHGEPGWRYRLPTEAEWEYACRGGPLADRLEQGFDYYFEKPGNELLAGQANFKSGKGMKRTGTVGSYRPNRLGLFDMHGNVSEWCEDEERDPKGASLRVARGGAFDDDPWNCRAAHHSSAPPSTLDGCVGLRLVRGVNPKKK
jgi:formylglycine-generating enzyme required for sulfatase activity